MLLRLSLLLLALAVSVMAQTSSDKSPQTPPAPSIFDATLDEAGAKTPEISTNDLKMILGEHSATVLDTRPPKEFAASHIPGAVNVPFLENGDARGTFRPTAELAERFRAAVGSLSADRVVCYCGSGVTACQDVLALEHAGLHGAKLYAGSWSEWSSAPHRPVATSE